MGTSLLTSIEAASENNSWLLIKTDDANKTRFRRPSLGPTCTVGPLVGHLPFQASVLGLGERRQLGGDMLLQSSRLVHLVGGADQLDGQVGLGG